VAQIQWLRVEKIGEEGKWGRRLGVPKEKIEGTELPRVVAISSALLLGK
jgi:hypothetical protein